MSVIDDSSRPTGINVHWPDVEVANSNGADTIDRLREGLNNV